MRPIRLEFSAFGSYPGRQVVDFDVLGRRGLFVVTGPTGTGKTTVFDAMVYALFGTMPGARQGISDLRSHFAAPDVETSVTLEFEVDGTRYVVTRSPRQERPKQRGAGFTEVAPKATLVRTTATGTESVATQTKSCTEACVELVGLDATRFQRVVLLPQGKFTEFLIATDDDRESLLRQLFGGKLYEDMVKWLKDRVATLTKSVGDVEEQQRHYHLSAAESLVVARREWAGDESVGDGESAADPALDVDGTELIEVSAERLRELAAALEPQRAVALTAIDELTRRSAAAQSAATDARATAARFDGAATLRTRLEMLDAARPSVEADAARAEQAATARPGGEAEQAREAAATRHAVAERAVADIRSQVEAAFAVLGVPAPEPTAAAVAAAVQAAGHQLSGDEALLATVDTADVEARRAHAEHATALDARDRAADAQAAALVEVVRVTDTVDASRQAATGAEVLRGQVAAADEQRERRVELDRLDAAMPALQADRDRLEHDYTRAMARFVATQAPRLAEQLVDGAPCSVCGSVDHPAPAQHGDGLVVDHDAVDAARAVFGAADAALVECRTALEAVRTSLGADATASVDEVVARHAELVARLDAAPAAAATLASAESALATAQQAAEVAAALAASTAADLVRVEATLDRARTDLETARAAAAHLDPAALAERRRTVAAVQGIADQLGTAMTALELAASAVAATSEDVRAALAASGIDSVDAARALVIDPAAEAQARDALSALSADVNDATSRLDVLHQQGVPAERPDVEALESVAVGLAGEVTGLTARVTTAADALDRAVDALETYDSVGAASADVRAAYDDARIVYRTCAGEAGMRVRLERWVLAGELDRVTDAANVHLATMTGHRYRLVRDRTSKGGLTLEVFDAHNGRTRATASLSGGEQFQASLSLALGLADVVSHGGAASGRTFDALFVDEGFGSLDPDALEDAIRALALLHASGRMVGAITHVEAMKQQLHVGIEVRRLPDGKGSTLVVNP
ncbi:MAG: AAA family ATPase [Ilumatobacteraceae bacterium]